MLSKGVDWPINLLGKVLSRNQAQAKPLAVVWEPISSDLARDEYVHTVEHPR